MSLADRCHARRHLKGAALSVYEFSVGVSKAGEGFFFCSNATVCDGTGYSLETVIAAKKKLLSEGWWRLEADSKQGARAGGHFRPNSYQVVEHEEWVAEHAGQCRPRIGKVPTRENAETEKPENPDTGKPDFSETGKPPHVFREEVIREKRQETSARDFAFKSFEGKFGQKPAWAKKDFVQLADLFKRRPELTLEEFSRRWNAYLDSTEGFICRQGWSLAYFCSKFDSFIAGPIHDRGAAPKKSAAAQAREDERKRNEVTPEGQALLKRFGVES